jgi:hypothetical protein
MVSKEGEQASHGAEACLGRVQDWSKLRQGAEQMPHLDVPNWSIRFSNSSRIKGTAAAIGALAVAAGFMTVRYFMSIIFLI